MMRVVVDQHDLEALVIKYLDERYEIAADVQFVWSVEDGQVSVGVEALSDKGDF